MLFMLDNYDSFTYNLVQYFSELGVEVVVARNDEITAQAVEELSPKYIVISPGPCDPDQAGVSLELIRHFAGKLPILGVCLGHQALSQLFGGVIVRAREPMHGKLSTIYHDGKGVFQGLSSPLKQTRYHSLVVELESVPDCLEITAWTQDEEGKMNEIMGIRHKQYMIEGVQFHPESILSEHGYELLNNFLKQHKGER